jgi:hypothetical protein
MADLGFPSREEAVLINARLDPASFVPAAEKKSLRPGGFEYLPVPLSDDTLLTSGMALSRG